MNYKAVLFDLDGTLLDTIEDIAEAMNSVLLAAGLPARPDVAEHKHLVGDGVRAYIIRAAPEEKRGDEALIARLTAEYRSAYAAGWRNKTRPYDGIEEMLDELQRRSVRLAVLSNKPDDSSREMIAHFLGGVEFEIVRGALDGVPLKPDPAAALAVAEQMSLAPARIAYLGDTATDMKTAAVAGMFAVGALWGFRTADELTANGAKTLIKHPTDLLKLI